MIKFIKKGSLLGSSIIVILIIIAFGQMIRYFLQSSPSTSTKAENGTLYMKPPAPLYGDIGKPTPITRVQVRNESNKEILSTRTFLTSETQGIFKIEKNTCGGTLPPYESCYVDYYAFSDQEGSYEGTLSVGTTRVTVQAIIGSEEILVFEAEKLSSLHLLRGKTPSPWVEVRLINKGKHNTGEMGGKIQLSGRNPGAFEIKSIDGRTVCEGSIPSGGNCKFLVRSINDGSKSVNAVIIAWTRNNPRIALQSNSLEKAASLEIIPKNWPEKIANEQTLPQNQFQEGESEFTLINRGSLTSHELLGHIALLPDTGAFLEPSNTNCGDALLPGQSCEIKIRIIPLKPGPFRGKILVHGSNENGGIGEKRTIGTHWKIQGIGTDHGISITDIDGHMPSQTISSKIPYILKITGTENAARSPLDPRLYGENEKMFQIYHDCPQRLQPKQSCQITVQSENTGVNTYLSISPIMPKINIRVPL